MNLEVNASGWDQYGMLAATDVRFGPTSPRHDGVIPAAIESLLQIPMVATTLMILSMGATLLFWRNIWMVRRERSLLGKVGWSLVVCVPLAGWVLYGGLGKVPKSHQDIPKHWESDGLG
jgi:hypothetical protein